MSSSQLTITALYSSRAFFVRRPEACSRLNPGCDPFAVRRTGHERCSARCRYVRSAFRSSCAGSEYFFSNVRFPRLSCAVSLWRQAGRVCSSGNVCSGALWRKAGRDTPCWCVTILLYLYGRVLTPANVAATPSLFGAKPPTTTAASGAAGTCRGASQSRSPFRPVTQLF